jgi:hypothetical protein
MMNNRIRHLPASLTTGIVKGSRVLLPNQATAGIVDKVIRFSDGTPQAFAVMIAGESLPILVPLGDAMRAPPGALFLASGGDDCPPGTVFFPARGGVA